MASIITKVVMLMVVLAVVNAGPIPEMGMNQWARFAMMAKLYQSEPILRQNGFDYRRNSFRLVRCHEVNLGESSPYSGYNCDAVTDKASYQKQRVMAAFNIDIRYRNNNIRDSQVHFNDLVIRAMDSGLLIGQISLPREMNKQANEFY